VEPPCYGCVSCSKTCPGWGVTEGHFLATAPFAAINKTRRRTFLIADAEVILLSGRVSREILLTLMSTNLATESKTADFGELASEQVNFLANRQGPPAKARAPNICTSRPGSPRERSRRPAGNKAYSSGDVAGDASANYTVAYIVDSHDTVSGKALVVQVGLTRV
jgi:hypothetical protein